MEIHLSPSTCADQSPRLERRYRPMLQPVARERKNRRIRKQLQHLLSLDPDYPEALVIQAKISTARKHYEEALKILDRADRIQPEGTTIHAQRWEIQKLLNDESAAEAAWKKMIFYQSIPRFTYLNYSS